MQIGQFDFFSYVFPFHFFFLTSGSALRILFKRSGDNRRLASVLTSMRLLQVFVILSIMLAVGFSSIDVFFFFMLRYVLYSPTFSPTFAFQASWILSKEFLHLLRWSCVFLSSSTFILFITFNDAWILNQSYISVVNLAWSWWLIFFYVCLVFCLQEFYWALLDLCFYGDWPRVLWCCCVFNLFGC